MVYGLLNQGSGAGNQLHRMIATRVKALDLGVDWRLIWVSDNSGKPMGFKCKDFMDFNQNKVVELVGGWPCKVWYEKKVTNSNGVDIRSYDPEWNFIDDETVIEGELQDSRYWEHREKEVDEWLKVEPLEVPDDTCVIGFRGGEFSLYPDLFLTHEYWEEAVCLMINNHGIKRFEVHSDDIELAREFFSGSGYSNVDGSEFKYIHDIGINWRSMRYAKHAIIANSSFFILPRWLRHAESKFIKRGIPKLDDAFTIAPRFWGRRNTKVWSLPQNYYKRFKYI